MLTSSQKRTLQIQIQRTITEQSPTEVRNAVLYELHRWCHSISSDDILELTVLIPPPQHSSHEQQIERVLNNALDHLDQWQQSRTEL